MAPEPLYIPLHATYALSLPAVILLVRSIGQDNSNSFWVINSNNNLECNGMAGSPDGMSFVSVYAVKFRIVHEGSPPTVLASHPIF